MTFCAVQSKTTNVLLPTKVVFQTSYIFQNTNIAHTHNNASKEEHCVYTHILLRICENGSISFKKS